MVDKVKINTNKDRGVRVKYYGEERFQTVSENGEKLQVTADDYGFEAINWLIDEIERARENGEDRIIILAGEVRSGKSNLGCHIAARLGLSDVSNIRYDGKEYLRQLQKAEPGDVVWLDEGGRGMYYKNWMKKENKLINQMFQQIGAKNLVSIICLPHKNLLDKELRHMRVHYWGQVKFQGYDRGFVKWRMSGKKKRRLNEVKVPRHHNEWKINVYWEPLFKMRFPKFREMNGLSWEDYERNKMKRLNEFGNEALDDSGEDVKETVKKNRQFVKNLKEKDGKTVDEIAKVAPYSKSHIYRILREEE